MLHLLLLSECSKMSFLLTLTLFISLRGATFSSSSSSSSDTLSISSTSRYHRSLDCGIRPIRRQPRHSSRTSNTQEFFYNDRIPKIIAGTPTKEGQFPWQASLELLHPSMGFLGHWCGGVLIDKYWVLSAAHCVHNDLFNLPLPPLWTIVLGEYDRDIESGYEQRIPVEKIVLHRNYHNFRHDLVLMKLSVPADLSRNSNIRKICLPFSYDDKTQSMSEYFKTPIDEIEYLEKDDNFLRKIRTKNSTIPSMRELLATKIIERLKKATMKRSRTYVPKRRNDKLMSGFVDDLTDTTMTQAKHHHTSQQEYQDLPYLDCVATGWGKFNLSGDLTDILLKTNVPLHNSVRCRAAYGSFVKIHKGHLCAGKLNGNGGTCVGDSGGPLQCRITKNGPWILAGVTSFGSGCALEGFPDVYTRTSFYMKWILDTINGEN